MLKGRKEELTYTNTGKGLAIFNNVKFLPIQQVMTVLRNEYGADAQLTAPMITGIKKHRVLFGGRASRACMRACLRAPPPFLT